MKIITLIAIVFVTAVSFAVAPIAAQTPPKVLAELFDNFGCSNCPQQDDPYYSFVAANPSYGIVVVSYHNNIGDQNDVFFTRNSSDINARDIFYDVAYDPTGVIDGYPQGNTHVAWESATNADVQQPVSNFIPKAVIEPDGLIHIVFSATGPSTGQSKVRVILKESNLTYHNSDVPGEGNPPGDIWNDIFRALLPNSSDNSPLGVSETRSFDVPFDPTGFLFGDKWLTDNMEAVVIVQDVNASGSNNYNVESIGVVSLKNPSGVSQAQSASSSSLRVVGSPANSRFFVELNSSAQVKVILSDMLGREVHIAADAMMPEGQTSIQMASGILPAGCYIARMIVDGNEVDHAKLIVQ